MRWRRAPGDEHGLRAEVPGLVALTHYGVMLGADARTLRAYERLVEVAAALGVDAPPPMEAFGEWGERTEADEWLDEAGLYHVGGRWCSGRDGGHWAHQCRG